MDNTKKAKQGGIYYGNNVDRDKNKTGTGNEESESSEEEKNLPMII